MGGGPVREYRNNQGRPVNICDTCADKHNVPRSAMTKEHTGGPCGQAGHEQNVAWAQGDGDYYGWGQRPASRRVAVTPVGPNPVSNPLMTQQPMQAGQPGAAPMMGMPAMPTGPAAGGSGSDSTEGGGISANPNLPGNPQSQESRPLTTKPRQTPSGGGGDMQMGMPMMPGMGMPGLQGPAGMGSPQQVTDVGATPQGGANMTAQPMGNSMPASMPATGNGSTASRMQAITAKVWGDNPTMTWQQVKPIVEAVLRLQADIGDVNEGAGEDEGDQMNSPYIKAPKPKGGGGGGEQPGAPKMPGAEGEEAGGAAAGEAAGGAEGMAELLPLLAL